MANSRFLRASKFIRLFLVFTFVLLNLSSAMLFISIEPSTASESTPPARYKHAMVYNPSQNQLIMFGGRYENSIGSFLNDTWLFDCTALKWDLVETGIETIPSVRAGHSMVFDSTRNRVILHSQQETWVFNISSHDWNQVETMRFPDSRTDFGMVYDSLSDQVFLFGGVQTETGTYYDDIWAFNCSSNDWEVCDVGETKPTARYGVSMVYNINSGKVILFGGSSGYQKANDLWEFQPNTLTWHLLNIPNLKPEPRYWTGLSLDEANSRLILFSGSANYPDIPHDTWEFDLTSNQWSQLNLSIQPSKRLLHPLVYNNLSDRMFLYGGADLADLNTPYDDLWKFDCSTNEWAIVDLADSNISGPLKPLSLLVIISICVIGAEKQKKVRKIGDNSRN